MDKRLHNGGAMAFGNDGKLYITMGDAGIRDNAITLNDVHGTLIRLNEDGTVPYDNPYTKASGYENSYRCADTEGRVPKNAPEDSYCGEIWAHGLRNPFRLDMDHSVTDKVKFTFSVVGAQHIEALFYGGTDYKGTNYGWPTYEGICRPAQMDKCEPNLDDPSITMPFHWYEHISFENGGCVGGQAHVPPGVFPPQFKYLFIDFILLKIYNLEVDRPDLARDDLEPPLPPTRNETFYTSIQAEGANINEARMVDLWFGPYKDTQALYVTKFGNHDTVLRIRYNGVVNKPPKPDFTYDYWGALGVKFDASLTTDPEGDKLKYKWDFGDESESDKTFVWHTYAQPGEYSVTLRVTDKAKQEQQMTTTVKVGYPPTVQINSPAANKTFSVGEILRLEGEAVDFRGNPIPKERLSWEVRQHHADHFHPFLDPTTNMNDFDLYPAPNPEDYLAATNSFLKVLLTAKDEYGLTETVSVDVMPEVVMVNVTTQPPGLEVSVDGFGIEAPKIITSWNDYSLPVTVADQLPYIFKEWSDGRTARSRTIEIFEEANGDLPQVQALFCRAFAFNCENHDECCSGYCSPGMSGICSVMPSLPTSPPTFSPTISPTTSPPTMSPTSTPTKSPPTSPPTVSPTSAPTTISPTSTETTMSPTLTISPTSAPYALVPDLEYLDLEIDVTSPSFDDQPPLDLLYHKNDDNAFPSDEGSARASFSNNGVNNGGTGTQNNSLMFGLFAATALVLGLVYYLARCKKSDKVEECVDPTQRAIDESESDVECGNNDYYYNGNIKGAETSSTEDSEDNNSSPTPDDNESISSEPRDVNDLENQRDDASVPQDSDHISRADLMKPLTPSQLLAHSEARASGENKEEEEVEGILQFILGATQSWFPKPQSAGLEQESFDNTSANQSASLSLPSPQESDAQKNSQAKLLPDADAVEASFDSSVQRDLGEPSEVIDSLVQNYFEEKTNTEVEDVKSTSMLSAIPNNNDSSFVESIDEHELALALSDLNEDKSISMLRPILDNNDSSFEVSISEYERALDMILSLSFESSSNLETNEDLTKTAEGTSLLDQLLATPKQVTESPSKELENESTPEVNLSPMKTPALKLDGGSSASKTIPFMSPEANHPPKEAEETPETDPFPSDESCMETSFESKKSETSKIKNLQSNFASTVDGSISGIFKEDSLLC